MIDAVILKLMGTTSIKAVLLLSSDIKPCVCNHTRAYFVFTNDLRPDSVNSLSSIVPTRSAHRYTHIGRMVEQRETHRTMMGFAVALPILHVFITPKLCAHPPISVLKQLKLLYRSHARRHRH